MQESALSDKAKRYSSEKYFLAILETVYLLFILFIFLSSGFSRALVGSLKQFVPQGFPLTAFYFFCISLGYAFFDLPLNFYRTYILERKFSLTNQKIGDWVLDQLKTGLISYCIGLFLIGSFYYALALSSRYWWLFLSLVWIFFSVVLAKLFPVVIIPMFFKYKKFPDGALRDRIINLAEKLEIRLLDIFEIDFSKKTQKANAAFVGIGKSRRVILADTLKDKYSFDEVEVIIAHEFAHFKLKHLVKLVVLNTFVTLALFFLIYKTSPAVLSGFGFSSLSDLAALPTVFIYFILFGVFSQPVENFVSRKYEKEADALALCVTGAKSAFIATMEKLAAQNLADRRPHPVIKFFFFDHPPIDERIALAK